MMLATSSLTSLHSLVWTALMAAMIAVGAFLSMPIGPVPFTMQPFFVMLAGLLLGWPYGMIAVLLYIAAGTVGLPVFAGGYSGLAPFFGPTGGYILGFVLAAGIIGSITCGKRPNCILGIAAGLLGLTALYFCGVLNLMRVLQVGWEKALAIGFLPFILQDLIKLILAVATWRILKSRRFLPS